ncbi:MAG: hypothetical protein FWC43_14410, partial [Planctomycetaceae bacterium]|nr:hypothetical protein [Planctomycetaceae bacterium]
MRKLRKNYGGKGIISFYTVFHRLSIFPEQTAGLQSRFFPGNAGFRPASEFVGILPVQGGDFIPQPSRRLEACV